MSVDLLPQRIRDRYEVRERHHATSVLKSDFEKEWNDLVQVLTNFVLKKSHIAKAGGNKSAISIGIDGLFASRGWLETRFDIDFNVTATTKPRGWRKSKKNPTPPGSFTSTVDLPTHKVDYFKNEVAVETEWYNKDPFYDRDLTNFRLLHEIGVVSVRGWPN